MPATARSSVDEPSPTMPKPRALSQAASATSLACARYLMQAANDATRLSRLSDQVIGCVARRQLSPEFLEISLRGFAAAHAGSAAQLVGAAVTRFADGLAQATFLPELDDAEPSHHSTGQARRAYRAALDRLLAQELGRTADLWFEFLGELDRVRADLLQRHLVETLRHLTPIGFSGDVIELDGPINRTVSADLSLENRLPGTSTVRCTVGEVRRADGVGPAFAPNLVLSPVELELGPGSVGSIHLSVTLEERSYEAGLRYLGALQLAQDREPTLELPLSIAPGPARDP